MLKQFYQILGLDILKPWMKIHRRPRGYNKILLGQIVIEYYNTYIVRNSTKRLIQEKAAKWKISAQLKFLFLFKADPSKDVLTLVRTESLVPTNNMYFNLKASELFRLQANYINEYNADSDGPFKIKIKQNKNCYVISSWSPSNI